MSDELYQAMAQSIVDGKVDLATSLARQALDQGIDPLEAINNGYVVGVKTVGDNFSEGTAFIPELVLAGAAMKGAMQVLEPEIAKSGTKRESLGTVVLATIEGDIHDIGKNLVGTMFSAYGFEVCDLGVNVPIADILQKADDLQADIIAVSALLTTTMMKQAELVKDLEASGKRANYKVIVGGAPVTQKWVDEIGADGFSQDAVGAVSLAERLMEKD